MDNTNLVIIVVLIIVTFFTLRNDKIQYEKFKSLSNTNDRLKYFKRWVVESFIFYGLISIIILFGIGQIASLKEMPYFLSSFVNSIKSSSIINDSKSLSGFFKGIAIMILPALLFGPTIATILLERRNFKNAKSKESIESSETDFRNLNAIIPLNYKERIWGFILSINAGFSEELFFRVLLPILIYSITDSIAIAIIGSTLWFGLAHYYQGISGIIATFFIGILIFGIYLTTQNIWLTMLVHVVLDLNGLVLSPWLKEKYENKIQ